MRDCTSKELAERYHVSRAWVDALKQRRRETGAFAPRQANEISGSRVGAGRRTGLAALIAARPDATLAELREALPDDRRVEHALARNRPARIHRQKKRYTPTNNVGLTSPLPAGAGRTWQPLRDVRQYVFLDECGVTTDLLRRYGRSPRGHAPARPHAVQPLADAHRRRGAAASTASTAPAVFDGPIDNPSFSPTSSKCSVPTLRPGDVVVLDNLAVHKQPEVRAAIEAVGAPSGSCRPTVPTSIRSNSPSRN